MRGFERDNYIRFRAYRRRRKLRAVLAFFLLSLGALCFAAAAVFDMDAWNKLDMNRILGVPRSLIVADASGADYSVLHATEDRIWVPLSDVPEQVRNAFISAEDARFYEHFGIDLIRIAGAAWADLKAGAYVQGASTISQQLIKLSHLSNEKEMSRKLEEAVLAYQLERLYSKDEILEMYLNYVYFGGGFYGIEAAARGYYAVSAKDLTVAQAAQLAGILKSPSRFAPHLHMEASVGRRNVVLELMRDYGYITDTECERYQAEPVVLRSDARSERRGYYVDTALTEAAALLSVDMSELLSGGYRIETALDADLQTACEALFADDTLFPSGAEAALVVVNVESGGVAALLGGRSSDAALGFNRATMIRRQPGSVIKPILVYAPALEVGYTAATMLLDEQIDFNGYRPNNASGTFSGWVTMREAVTRSLNVPAVTVFSRIGVSGGKRFAEKLGVPFDEQDKSLALALGGFTYGVSPYQIASAYAAFARGGVYEAPGLIERITDGAGNVLYTRSRAQTRVMREGNAYVLTSMLQSVVETGTGRRLGALGIPLAGKTGTTGDADGNRDIWMAAYNPAYAATVWIGMDDSSDGRMLEEDATGGTYPAELLKRIFGGLYDGKEAPDFTMPSTVREYRIDRYTLDTEHTAVLAGALTPETEAYREVFVVGTEPRETSSYWSLPQPPALVTAKPVGQTVFVGFDTPGRYMLYRLYREDTDGRSVLLAECSGENGSVSFLDEGVKAGARYFYYVIPVHPRLTVMGQQLTGEVSMRIGVTAGDVTAGP